MTTRRKRMQALVQRINATSNADFVKRLLDEKRKTIPAEDGKVMTHRLGYVEEDGHAVVFPDVQSDGDSLRLFHYPESYERAVQNGDTVQMSPRDALMFTTHYKEYYPGFNKYDGKGKSWLRRAFDTMQRVSAEVSENMRDVRTAGWHNAVKDLQDRGDYEGAQALNKKLMKANAIGIESGIGAGTILSLDPKTSMQVANALGQAAKRVANSAVGRAAAPGSHLWTNPLVQQFAASTLGGTAIDAGSKALTGKTWGQNLVSSLSDVTGYDISSIPGANFVADMTNPGYITPYGIAERAVSYLPKQVAAARDTEAAIRKLRANTYLRDIVSNQNPAKRVLQNATLAQQGTKTSPLPKSGYDTIANGVLQGFAQEQLGSEIVPSLFFKHPTSVKFGLKPAGMYPDDYPTSVDFSPLVKRIQKASEARDRAYNYLQSVGYAGEKPHIIFSPDDIIRSASTGPSPYPVQIIGVGGLDRKLGSIGNVTSHETAHANPIYNTRSAAWVADNSFRSPSSPYYGNDYSKISDSTMDLLRPRRRVNPHDFETAENYSDLIGLKDDLHRMGIHRMTSSRPYTWLDVKLGQLSQMLPGGNYIRYLDYHAPRETVKALNTVKAWGGLIERYGTDAVRKALKNRYDDGSRMWRAGQVVGFEIPVKEEESIQVPYAPPANEGVIVVSNTPQNNVLERPELFTEEVLPARDNTALAVQLLKPDKPLSRDSFSIVEDVAIKARLGENKSKLVNDAVSKLKSGDELKEFQKELLQKGYYKDIKVPEIKARTKEDVAALQQKLLDAGYDLGKYGVDGKLGKFTRAAWAQYVKDHPDEALLESVADGKMGPATRAAATRYYNDAANAQKRTRPDMESIPKAPVIQNDELALQMYRDIPMHQSWKNMMYTVLPAHYGAYRNKQENQKMGDKLGIEDYDAYLADSVEEAKQQLTRALQVGNAQEADRWRDSLRVRTDMLPANKLNPKSLSRAEQRAVVAALSYLNGNKEMTYDDYLSNLEKLGKQPGSYLGTNPRHYDSDGKEVFLYDGKSGYNLMNEWEDEYGYKNAVDPEGEFSEWIGENATNIINAENRIYHEPLRGRLGAFSYYIDKDGNIHISDKLEATEAKADRGRNDDESYNGARDYFPRASTAPIEYVIPANRAHRWLKTANRRAEKKQRKESEAESTSEDR